MAFKLFVFAALVAVVRGGALLGHADHLLAPAPVAYSAPAAYAQPIGKAVLAKTVDADFDPNPQYTYAYDVQDGLTGDSKTQQETRNGDVVQGSYSLVEADGTRRIVEYTADPENGFNAVIHKEPAHVAVKAVAAAPVATPVIKAVHAAPALYSAPAAYAAPVYAHAKVAAPLAYGPPAYQH